MSRHARQAVPGADRPEPQVREAVTTPRPGQFGGAPEQAGNWAAAPGGRAVSRRAGSRRAGRAGASGVRAGTVGVVTYLAVVVCTAAGVYISWRQGSNGGGRGAVVAGAALLVAAAARLLLPGKLAGLLASRRRVTDVLTLTVFGAGLLAAGLVLPGLGSLSVPGRMAGPPMKGKHE